MRAGVVRRAEPKLLLLTGEDGAVMPEHKNDTLMVAAPLASLAEVVRKPYQYLFLFDGFWYVRKCSGFCLPVSGLPPSSSLLSLSAHLELIVSTAVPGIPPLTTQQL